MKRFYTLSILASFMLLGGCSKDFLKSYDKRILGTWRITDVNRVGIGGNPGSLPFRSGTFTFNENGTLSYVDANNVTYQGSWDIRKRTVDEERIQSLQVTAIGFATQQVLMEYYDDINFRSTNHFTANIISDFQTFVTHFRR